MMAWTQHDRAAEGEIPACVAGAIPARSFEVVPGWSTDLPRKGEKKTTRLLSRIGTAASYGIVFTQQ